MKFRAKLRDGRVIEREHELTPEQKKELEERAKKAWPEGVDRISGCCDPPPPSPP